jgi:hypothetical protein
VGQWPGYAQLLQNVPEERRPAEDIVKGLQTHWYYRVNVLHDTSAGWGGGMGMGMGGMGMGGMGMGGIGMGGMGGAYTPQGQPVQRYRP